jgi:hypothetical protein
MSVDHSTRSLTMDKEVTTRQRNDVLRLMCGSKN